MQPLMDNWICDQVMTVMSLLTWVFMKKLTPITSSGTFDNCTGLQLVVDSLIQFQHESQIVTNTPASMQFEH
jgi:hypothetical protein